MSRHRYLCVFKIVMYNFKVKTQVEILYQKYVPFKICETKAIRVKLDLIVCCPSGEIHKGYENSKPIRFRYI